MYKGTITEEIHVEANTDIPFTTVYNDGVGTSMNQEGKPTLIDVHGHYDLNVLLNIKGVQRGNFDVMLFSNGNLIKESVSSAHSNVTTEKHTLTIRDVLNTFPGTGSVASLSVRVSVPCTIMNGVFTVR